LQTRFKTEGFYVPQFGQDNLGQGSSFQLRYKIDQKLTLISRYDIFYTDKDDKNGRKLESRSNGLVPNYFGYQHDAMLGFSYDFADDFRVNAEYHWVEGAARLNPIVLPNSLVNNKERWDMWAVQFMYWF